MSYSISTAEQDLEGMLHGTTLNQITNLTNLENRAARQLLLDIDPQETKRTAQFVNPIFNSVFDYPIADDVKGNKIIDIYPQVERIPQDIWTQAYNQAFDVAKQNIFSMANMFTMNFDSGIKTIRLNCPFLNPPVIINQIEGISVNGTWATGGTASNLSVNNSNFAQGAGSLQFNVTSGVAYLENSTMYPVNLSEVENQSSIFTWVYVPDSTKLTSVEVRFGSSASDYWTGIVTQNQQGNSFINGWNLCEFVWSSLSSVGTPDSSVINYARITLNVTGTMTGCLINGLDSILGTILQYEYYSKYLFRNATTGAFQETVSSTSDLINLDTDSYNLYTNLLFLLAAQQQNSAGGTFDIAFIQAQYDKGIARYKSMYKSELQKPQGIYYAQPDTSYNKFLGRGWW